MTKLVLVVLAFALITLTCAATVYNVGDTSGWDISTDLQTWVKDKTFLVGDSLWFQYSSYHSVSEVTKQNYEGCNTTNVLQSSSNGNTSYALGTPGDKYFICGNRLHCFGGMKLHVLVEKNPSLSSSSSSSPEMAPQAQPGGSFPPHSSKSNNPSVVVVSGSASYIHVGLGSLSSIWLGFSASTFLMALMV